MCHSISRLSQKRRLKRYFEVQLTIKNFYGTLNKDRIRTFVIATPCTNIAECTLIIAEALVKMNAKGQMLERVTWFPWLKFTNFRFDFDKLEQKCLSVNLPLTGGFFGLIFEAGSCYIGLLLSALAFLDKELWEQVTTGGTGDLFQEGPLGSQAMTKRIADFANGSKEPQLMTLSPNIGGKSHRGVEKKKYRVEKLTFAESF